MSRLFVSPTAALAALLLCFACDEKDDSPANGGDGVGEPTGSPSGGAESPRDSGSGNGFDSGGEAAVDGSAGEAGDSGELDAASGTGADAASDAAADAASDAAADALADASDDSVRCTSRGGVMCRRLEPDCPEGEVPRVVDQCWGECVPIDTCVCDVPDDCPHREVFTCLNTTKHCSYYLF